MSTTDAGRRRALQLESGFEARPDQIRVAQDLCEEPSAYRLTRVHGHDRRASVFVPEVVMAALDAEHLEAEAAEPCD